jgi:hypothetical protein
MVITPLHVRPIYQFSTTPPHGRDADQTQLRDLMIRVLNIKIVIPARGTGRLLQSQRDFCRNVRFTPNSGHEMAICDLQSLSVALEPKMSALPPKADIG